MIKKVKSTITFGRVVVKFGTSLLTAGTSKLDHDMMSDLVDQIARLHLQGVEVVLVTSGAIAAGREKLKLTRKIRDIPYKQVLASVGQSRLMNLYERLFNKYEITVAQALLTKADLENRHGYLNARNTLLALLEMGVVCIVNENDVVAVDEIKEAKFGDNDNLSAMVANLIDADLLMIVTDIEGLYTADPNKNTGARLIPVVKKIDARIEGLVSGSTNGLGTGGMITKIEAAKMATACGITVVIANGHRPDVLMKIVSGEQVGTRFVPAAAQLGSRERWMLSGLRTRGTVVIDDGAVLALKRQKRSLLAAGIQQVTGNFRRGDIVNICDMRGVRLGCGITNYDTEELLTIKGIHSDEISSRLGHDYGSEVVHRNNLVML